MNCTSFTKVIDEIDNKLLGCCLGSAFMMVYFLDTLQDSCKMGHVAAINYLKSVGALVDFRNASGVSDLVTQFLKH